MQTASVHTLVKTSLLMIVKALKCITLGVLYCRVLSCCIIYILCIMRACLEIESYTVIYVCGVRVSIRGSIYTEVWQRLSCESEGSSSSHLL